MPGIRLKPSQYKSSRLSIELNILTRGEGAGNLDHNLLSLVEEDLGEGVVFTILEDRLALSIAEGKAGRIIRWRLSVFSGLQKTGSTERNDCL